MPHSSGGGSHGGGSHSGGSHHSRSHHSSSHHSEASYRGISSKAYPGAKKYVYYFDRRPRYFYSDIPPETLNTNSSKKDKLIVLLICAFFIIIGLYAILPAMSFPSKLNAPAYDIQVDDTACVLSDTDSLYSVLEEFYSKTGVCTCVMTVHNEDWEEFGTLENYVFSLYVNKFSDEDHWLIVYSEPENPNPEFNDWYWEGMQGDNTDKILKNVDEFNRRLTKYLYADGKYSVEDAIRTALSDYTVEVQKVKWDPGAFVFLVFWMVLPALILKKTFGPFSKVKREELRKKYHESHSIPLQSEELVCEYCGGIYIAHTCLNCPHCGASLPPSNTVLEEYITTETTGQV